MPEISRFLGIVIAMFSHFHAYYGGYEVAVGIRDGAVLWGSLPSRALGHVQKWCAAHVLELLRNWRRAREHEPLEPIAPLE